MPTEVKSEIKLDKKKFDVKFLLKKFKKLVKNAKSIKNECISREDLINGILCDQEIIM